MGHPVRIVHYLNQFFGEIGGEDRAETPLPVREGAVGPGRAVEQILGAPGSVVATLIAATTTSPSARRSRARRSGRP